MNLRPMTASEHKYSYNQSTQLTGQTGCIGYLSGTLDAAGLFDPAWTNRRSNLNTDESKADREITLQALRHDGCILSNRNRLMAYCLDHLDSAMDRESREYGFRMDTDKYAYLLRLNPREGEVRIYCYVRDWLDRHIETAKKGIRFITPHYKDLFRLQDGGKIRIECGDGRTLEQVCRYIDEYHLEVGAYPHEEIYHICQFAELMERAGNRVSPVRPPACQIKNLSQLKKCLKAGSKLEITGHCRPECIGQIRKITLANTQGFYSIVDGQPSDSKLNQGNGGKGPVLYWSNAPFWSFQDGVCGLYSDKDHADENAGKTYLNHNGCMYLCTQRIDAETAVMVREADGWTLVAHQVRQFEDGSIEWDYSTNGHWPGGRPKASPDPVTIRKEGDRGN